MDRCVLILGGSFDPPQELRMKLPLLRNAQWNHYSLLRKSVCHVAVSVYISSNHTVPLLTSTSLIHTVFSKSRLKTIMPVTYLRQNFMNEMPRYNPDLSLWCLNETEIKVASSVLEIYKPSTSNTYNYI